MGRFHLLHRCLEDTAAVETVNKAQATSALKFAVWSLQLVHILDDQSIVTVSVL